MTEDYSKCSGCGEVDGCACHRAPLCETTGDYVDECDCSHCYYARHEEPKPCGQCGGVGGHMFGCV